METPTYTTEQLEMLVTELASQQKEAAESRGWLTIWSSKRIVQRGKQRFAVFCDTARDITPIDEVDYKFTPAVLDGHCWESVPDEGRSGVLGLVWTARCGYWFAGWMPIGWLYASELELSDAEIAENLVAEIERGDNVLTVPPPGWA